MDIKKSQVFNSQDMFPAYWWQCLVQARNRGYSYIDFNGMIFSTCKDQSPEFKNAICMREDLID